jgi:branched-chain amino acid transport system substrate-binding protein
VRTLQTTPSFELGGVRVSYGPGNHEGSHFVDLSLVSRDGQFIH